MTENQEATGELAARTALEQDGIIIDPGQKPLLQQSRLDRRYTKPGTRTIINRLQYRVEPPGNDYLDTEYLTTYRELGGPLRHFIPGENYRLEDSFLDGASIRVLENRNPLRVETTSQREPVRIAQARTDKGQK